MIITTQIMKEKSKSEACAEIGTCDTFECAGDSIIPPHTTVFLLHLIEHQPLALINIVQRLPMLQINGKK